MVSLYHPGFARYIELSEKRGRLSINPKTKKYFFPNGQKLKSGNLLINPEYAKTLTEISKNGAKAFYNGSIAEEIVNAAREIPNPGNLTLAKFEKL
ncbi:MAG: hypothetical protein CM1200mP1_07430 [Candidatus Neomarinimicrobiota bacterium]|nr:MAG: hypothetical protein CM1200mP1_07430 [Candidatus Neomarinimicrobiota bacterium]